MNESNSTERVSVKKSWMHRHPIWSIFITLIAVGIVTSAFSDNSKSDVQTTTSTSQVSNANPVATVQSKIDAQKELNDLIALSKKALLIDSYEFSDKASVVYVSSVWYTQTVAFKKDFMAKIATLKETITGYAHFEVRDVNSNEKVGEVTSFSRSLEVYK